MMASNAYNAMGNLTDDLITQFCNVTGASREDGRQMLEVCHGNLEMAIGMHMDQDISVTGRSIPNVSTSGSTSQGQNYYERSEPGAAATASDDLNGDVLRAPIPQRHEVLVEDRPRLPYLRRRRARTSVFDGFRDFQAETLLQETVMSGPSANKKFSLEDLFRPPIDMTFKGTFDMARAAGRSEKKWLLVNVHNVQEFACQVLNRDIWSDPSIKKLVKKYFVFWQVYHDSDEGNKFMQFYSVKDWPHVAVLDPVTGENVVTWNQVHPKTFIGLLRDFVNEEPSPGNPDVCPPKRQKLENSIVDSSEEAQLEAAIKASLAQVQQSATPTSSATVNDISESSDSDCDELETFSDSNSSTSSRSKQCVQSGSQEHAASLQKTCHSSSSAEGNGRVAGTDNASSSGAGAASVSFPRHGLSAFAEESLPSTSANREIARIVDDSENENSLGFRESYANTPNSVDIMGGRSWECNNIDSSSNGSSFAGSGVVIVDNDEDTVSCDRLSGEQSSGKAAEDSSPWTKHYGDVSDPKTKLLIRFPDGRKEHLSLPCSSKIKALFVFCSSKGYSEESYELLVNFPRRKLSMLSADSTIKEANLHPQETIFVQER